MLSTRENIVADVNIDGTPGLRFPVKDIVPQGAEHSTLSKDLEAAARRRGYTISPTHAPKRDSSLEAISIPS
jgi:hypothetical protein